MATIDEYILEDEASAELLRTPLVECPYCSSIMTIERHSSGIYLLCQHCSSDD